jgi:hypothetical protein
VAARWFNLSTVKTVGSDLTSDEGEDEWTIDGGGYDANDADVHLDGDTRG